MLRRRGLAAARRAGQTARISFHAQEKDAGLNLPPRLYRLIEDRLVAPGCTFAFELPPDTFIDPDEGEVLAFTACLESSDPLPDWLHFRSDSLFFSGRAPVEPGAVVDVVLRATDFDGAWAEGKMRIRIE